MSTSGVTQFTYEYLKSLLAAMKRNFQLRLFSEAGQCLQASSENILFLRHDVDLCLSKALSVAEIEHDMGVAATYYVAVDSLLYSMRNKEEIRIARRILELGHEIGLHHIGPTAHDDGLPAARLRADIRSARERLQGSLGAPIQSISFHRPAADVMNGPLWVEGMINAYAKELTSSYISDSAGRWKVGDPVHRVETGRDPILQVLIHPIWWGTEQMEPAERLQEFFDAQTRGMSPRQVEQFDHGLSETLGRVRRRGYVPIRDEHTPVANVH